MWSLYDEGGDFLKPLVFSNGKSQEDVVNEVVSLIKGGEKIIFIRGVCGTGKSAIALNIAKELGRASIVVPIRNLQKQYEDDYTNKKYLLKKNGEKLKIEVLTGRRNHKCKYIDGELQEFFVSNERDSKLSDFKMMMNNLIEKINKEKTALNKNKDDSCDNSFLPCKIEIAEKNFARIKEYLKRNTRINAMDFRNIHNVKRLSIAPVCPYWSPILPAELDVNLEARKRKYKGLFGREYVFYQRKEGCPYYEQFHSYIDADVLIFNSDKYWLESIMNRRPATDVEIIDECDEFLDSFANTERINLNRLHIALGYLFSENEKTRKTIISLIHLVEDILRDNAIGSMNLGEIIPIKDTKLLDVLKNFLDNNLMEEVECDEENYSYHADKVSRTFEDFFDETYVSFEKYGKDIVVNMVTVNLEKRFAELIERSKAIVLMSGTIHSPEVLRDIFGLRNFKIVEAETKMPGSIDIQRTGKEFNCNYEVFKLPNSRERFLKALDECIKSSKKPLLVNVTAFKDLPSQEEASNYGLSIMTKEKLIETQKNDSSGYLLDDFKQGNTNILYSTRCNRGIDFPGEMCNSIILTRFPYPDISSIFWRILKQTKPQYYDEFYRDKAKREFFQRIYRGLRSDSDHIFILSPDIRVTNFLSSS
ncbi:MAG: helicase C-terminal domain-containing protein [archaeon]